MTSLDLTELLIATHNAGKIAEFRALLSPLPVRLLSLADISPMSEPMETGETFEENARIKAAEYAALSGMYAFSDDSGLEVTALNGLPGVHSARYAGVGVGYDVKMAKLLADLAKSGKANRHARFVSVIALSSPEGQILHTNTGICDGTLSERPFGTNGFGYDPIFIPVGHERTFGEMPDDVKQKISHRAEAAASFITYLRNNLKN